MKRMGRLILFLTMLLLFAVPASAEELTSGAFTYTINEDGETVTITGSSSVPSSSLVIPAQLEGKTVTAIGNGAFYDSGAILEIVFPAAGTLTTIGENAFASCDSLQSVTLPEGLTTLGRESFGSCLLLREVHIPSTLTDAGSFYGPFTNSSILETVTFGEGTTYIPSHLFYGATIKAITLPDTLTGIGANAFTGCTNLRSVVIPEGVTQIEYQAFYGCTALSSVAFPSTLETIGNAAFRNTRLTSLQLPGSLRIIGDYAFCDCEGLVNVVIPEGVTTIGRETFGSIDSLVSVSIPASLTDAGSFYGPFTNSPILETVTFGEGTTYIPSHLFYGASIKTITLPDTLTGIGANAFTECTNLQSVVIPEGVTQVGYQAFYNCTAMTSVTLPSTLETIGNGAFYSTCLTKLQLPAGLTSIGDNAFYNCEGLETVALTMRAADIGCKAFGGIETLKSVRIFSELTYNDSYSPFTDSPNLKTAVLAGIESIPSHLFYGTSIETVSLPETLRSIGSEAFAYCKNLKSVTLPRWVETVGTSAFRDCTALTSAVLSPALSTPGNSLFYNCTALYSVAIPEGVTVLGKKTFQNCTSLTDIALPSSLTTISENAFDGCTSLVWVRTQRGLEVIKHSAFLNCTSLNSISMPDTVTKIEGRAFQNCDALPALFFEGAAPTIAVDSTFSDNTLLCYLYGEDGWTTPYYPNDDKYPTRPVLGEIDLSDRNYYEKLSDHQFMFIDHRGAPLTGVTMIFNEEEYTAENDQSALSYYFDSSAAEELTFQKDGYYSVTLPIELLDGISIIRMYPTSWSEPFIQAAFAKDAATGIIYDLLNGGLVLTEGDTESEYELYVQPNWVGRSAGSLYLADSPELLGMITGVDDGWNSKKNLSAGLSEGDRLYLLQYIEGTYETPLAVAVMEEELSATLQLGDDFTFENLSLGDLGFMSAFFVGFDLTEDLKVEMEIEKDGTVTGMLGVALEDRSELKHLSEKTKAQFVKEPDSGENLFDFLNYGNTSWEELIASVKKPGKWVGKGEGAWIGYFKGKLEQSQATGGTYIRLTEVGVGYNYEFKAKYPLQFLIAGIPHYASIGPVSNTQFVVDFYEATYGDVLKAKPVKVSQEIVFEPRYGVGYDEVLSAGVKAEFGIKVSAEFPMKEDNTVLDGIAKISSEYIVFAMESDIPLADFSGQLYPAEEAQLYMLRSAAGDAQWKPQSMDYLYAVMPFAVGEENTDTDVTVLATGVYPYAEAELVVLPDGTELAVWVAHGDNEPNNRTRLYYSYMADGSWSTPAPVNGADLTADFNPLLQVENGSAYLLWQDASRALTDSDDMTSTASVMDISAAVWTGEGFALLGSFGVANAYDGTMSLTMIDGAPAVAYTSNSSNNLFTGGLTTDLHRAVWNGEEWIDEVLTTGLGPVDHTAASGSSVWFSADAEGEGDPEKRELYCYDGSLTRLTENDVLDSKPVMAGERLIWFQDEVLTDGETEIPMEQVTDRYQYLSSGAMEALVYVASDNEQKSGLYASFNDGSGWGDPIALTAGETNIGSFSAQFLADGSLAVLALERTAYTDEDGFIAYTAGVLNRYTITVQGDLTLNGAEYEATTLLPNNDLVVYLNLTNSGMASSNAVMVTVLDGETELVSQAYLAKLHSGETGIIPVNVPLGDVIAQNLTVRVEPIGFTDATENTCDLTLNLTDLSLEEAVAFADDGTSVTVMAANRGQTVIESAVLNLTDEKGNVLATETVSDLAVRSAKFVTFQLEETLEANTLLYVQAEAVGTENLSTNNKTAVLVAEKSKGVFSVDAVVSADEENVKVTVTLTNTTDDVVTGNYICAAYDSSGKMLNCFTQLSHAVSAGKTDCLTYTFPKETAEVKVFHLDSGYAPVSKPVTRAVSQ